MGPGIKILPSDLSGDSYKKRRFFHKPFWNDRIHNRKLVAHTQDFTPLKTNSQKPLKIRKMKFPFGIPHFQGRPVSFGEGNLFFFFFHCSTNDNLVVFGAFGGFFQSHRVPLRIPNPFHFRGSTRNPNHQGPPQPPRKTIRWIIGNPQG